MNDSRPNGRRSGVPTLKLMPMIDVVFLLLVFFLCATQFPSPEGVLKTWLPKDQSIDDWEDVVLPEPVRLCLRMQAGRCVCDYEDTSSPTGFTRFAAVIQYDPQTRADEVIPDWDAIQRYIQRKKESHDRYGLSTRGLPVIIDFTPDVTWKHVACVVDICTGLQIRDLRVAMPDLAFND